MIRIALPSQLQSLAGLGPEVLVNLSPPMTTARLLDALEAQHPLLRGSIRDAVTLMRRPKVRFFACGEDLSHANLDAVLPQEVRDGLAPFMIIAAISGG